MTPTFTDEDAEIAEKLIAIKNKGYYADGKQVTEVYNRVLHKSASVTNCGSCLRGRIQELENALKNFKIRQNNASGGVISSSVEQSPTPTKITAQTQNNKRSNAKLKQKTLPAKKK